MNNNSEPAPSSLNKLSRETVESVSKLARLKLSEEEVAAFATQLSTVLENFEQISQVDTKDVQPLVTPTDMSMVTRDDVVSVRVEPEKILQNAPEKSGHLFKVPPVV